MRISRTRYRLIALAWGVATLSATLSGQVRQVQQGNALDANPMVGTGGRNTAIRSSRFNSNLYVTGQVTGLGRFRGDVPYRAQNELGITLPSAATVSNFLAESVGVGDVRQGRPLVPSPYFDRQRTIVARQQTGFSQNLRVGVPVENLTDAARRDLYLGATEGYARVQGAGEDAVALPPTTDYENSVVTPSAGGPRLRQPARELPSMVAAPVPGLFGLHQADERYRLAREISELDQQDRSNPVLDVGKAIQDRSKLEKSLADPASDTIGRPASSRPTPQEDADKDTFVQVMRHLQLKRLQEQGRDDADRQGAISSSRNVRLDDQRQIVIDRLAGEKPDVLNTFMRSAESQMQTGRFYEAAELFKRAGHQDPSNPLPQVGAGLALFAAGEPVSAARQIEAAFAEFPALMETRIVAGQMVPAHALRKQLGELEKKMDTGVHRDDPRMLMLASFLSKATGRPAQARQYARKLDEVSKGDRLMQAYSKYILTGKRPAGAIITPKPATPAASPEGPGQ